METQQGKAVPSLRYKAIHHPEVFVVNKELTRENILLSGLNCPSCAADLEKALKQLDGVDEAAVAFGTGTVEIAYDRTQLAPEQIDQVIGHFGLGVQGRL